MMFTPAGLTPEQRAMRVHTLGASEIAAVCGLNPWKSAHDVWLSKLELADEHVSHATRVGTLIEPIILRLYCEDTGARVAHFGTVVHPKHAWVSATPDFAVHGVRRVGEIKCVGWRSAGHWTTDEDGVPDYYRPQLEWQCEVCDADEADMAALIGGTDFRIYRIKRDREIGGMLLDIGAKFWRDHVEARVPPPVDGSDGARRMLAKLYPRNTGPVKKADNDVERIVRELRALDAVDAKRTELENKLRAAIADADGMTGDGWSVTYRADKNGKRALRWKNKGNGKEAA